MEEINSKRIEEIHQKVACIFDDVKQIKLNQLNHEVEAILDIYDVCHILKLSIRHVRRLSSEGHLTGFKSGKRRLWLHSEVMEYVKQNQRKPNS